ncbi:MAG: TldD/PmbA family protein [Candidatus Zhuqueibacterota bacterium]
MKSGTGLAITAVTPFWYDVLMAGKIPDGAQSFFEKRFGITNKLIQDVLKLGLSGGGDFSELYFQYKLSTSVRMEEDIIKESTEDISVGVGVRVLSGEKTGYGYTNDLTFESMKRAALTAAAIANSSSHQTVANLMKQELPHQVYDLEKTMSELDFQAKLSLVRDTYNAALHYDNRVTKVQAILGDSIEYITIANSDGLMISDVRPQTRLAAISLAEKDGIRNSGFYSGGGRVGLNYFQNTVTPKIIGENASEEAIILLGASDALAGEQPVVLGVGQSGVMIHEAVGHPLEADGNRKGTSIMSDKLGKKVATDLVTIYEDATIPHYRGSLNIDDEGCPTQKTMLVENGKLVGYIQDRLSARIMKMKQTGNGRRESFYYNPIPRMTNTVLAPGNSEPDEIIASVRNGFYAKTYQGGQVEDTGKFVFSVNLGYLIEDGKLTRPVKNATLIGTNVQILENITMVGNDMGYFLGTCGKEGQSVPVTAGTPTLKIERMTVGGRK